MISLTLIICDNLINSTVKNFQPINFTLFKYILYSINLTYSITSADLFMWKLLSSGNGGYGRMKRYVLMSKC